jgi:hypothetical protein
MTDRQARPRDFSGCPEHIICDTARSDIVKGGTILARVIAVNLEKLSRDFRPGKSG